MKLFREQVATQVSKAASHDSRRPENDRQTAEWIDSVYGGHVKATSRSGYQIQGEVTMIPLHFDCSAANADTVASKASFNRVNQPDLHNLFCEIDFSLRAGTNSPLAGIVLYSGMGALSGESALDRESASGMMSLLSSIRADGDALWGQANVLLALTVDNLGTSGCCGRSTALA